MAGPGPRSGRLLRRPVLGRAREDAGDGRGRRAAREAREAEVRDDDASGPSLDEDVRRRQIAMDDAACVGVRERSSDRCEQAACLVPVERPPGDDRVQPVPLDELEHEHRLALVLEHVVQPDDVRMLEARERRGLALEARAEVLVVRDPRV